MVRDSNADDFGEYSDDQVDFNNPEQGPFPEELDELKKWMGATKGDKTPLAPWADKNAPAPCNTSGCPADRADDPECYHDARKKWGYDGLWRVGERVDMWPGNEIEHRAFIFEEEDPFIFIDGDDIRCKETGDVHPKFKEIMGMFGLTWTEISQSGAGAHAVYAGDLPDVAKGKQPKLKFEDDEPFGEHHGDDWDDKDLPVIEIYPTTKVGVLTGKHVPGTPIEVNEIDDSGLLEALEEFDKTVDEEELESEPGSWLDDVETNDEDTSYEDKDATDDIQDIFNAISGLDSAEVGKQTIVEKFYGSESDKNAAFKPTWSSSDYTGQANYINKDGLWIDSGDYNGYGGPIVMAAIKSGIITKKNAAPGDVTGEDFFKAVEYLRDKCGFDEIPVYTEAEYMDVLGYYRDGGKSPYSDPDACLVASLKAREQEPVAPQKEPPTLAINCIIENMMGVPADSHSVTDTVRETACKTFEGLTAEEAIDRFELTVEAEDDDDDEDTNDTDDTNKTSEIVSPEPGEDDIVAPEARGMDRSRGEEATESVGMEITDDEDPVEINAAEELPDVEDTTDTIAEGAADSWSAEGDD